MSSETMNSRNSNLVFNSGFILLMRPELSPTSPPAYGAGFASGEVYVGINNLNNMKFLFTLLNLIVVSACSFADIVKDSIYSKAIEKNLIGERAVREILVYLPPERTWNRWLHYALVNRVEEYSENL